MARPASSSAARRDLQCGIEASLDDVGFEGAIDRVTSALEEEGFGILTTIDVKAMLKLKLDVDFRRYRILGACHAQLAYRALRLAPHMGRLLPCNVVLQEALEGGVTVSIADPEAMFALVDNPSLIPLAAEANERVRRVLAAVTSTPAPRPLPASPKESR